MSQPGDNARFDASAGAVLASSASGRALSGALAVVTRAWQSSAARRWSVVSTRAAGLRAVSVVAVCASLTALVLRALAPQPEPYTWVVPVAIGVAAVLMILLGPTTRAGDHAA